MLTARRADTESRGAEAAGKILAPRAVIVLVGVVAALAAATRLLPQESAAAWMAKVAGVSVLAALVPGALIVLAWRPRRSLELLELLGISIGISFVLVQLLTIVALTLHWSPARAIAALAFIAGAHGLAAFRRPNDGVELRIRRRDVALLLGLLLIGAYLYAVGAPFRDQEDRIHISIVQRLSRLPQPALDNIYLSPGAVYTYGFPGTHYMLALMSRIGDIEPIFLYHKLRAFWGVAALILLYGCARLVFDAPRIALATTIVAAALVSNGTFASVPGMYWGQLAPYSHASDVAMGVLLPSALLLSFAFLRAAVRREAVFFFLAAVGMAFMLVVVHPREIVQLAVYLTVLLVMLVSAQSPRVLSGRAAMLLATTVLAALGYGVWYQGISAGIDQLVRERREALLNLLTESSWSTLVGSPLPLLSDYMPLYDAIFRSWNAVVLLAGPLVLWVFRHERLAWLLAGSIAAYLLVMRFPLVAILYAYATYFEILYTPVRNVIFFVYLLAGTSLYLMAAWLAQRGRLTVLVAAPVLITVILGLFSLLGPIAAAHSELFLVVLLLAYVAVSFGMLRSRSRAAPAWATEPPPRWRLAFAVLLVPVALGTYSEESAVVRASWPNAQSTPARLMANLECRGNGQFCPPPAALIEFVRANVPADAILAVDYREAYEATLFMPQQAVVWSGATEGLADAERQRLFRSYFRHLERAQASALEQPLFNDGETRAERVAFLRDLEVTHVLVNPRLYPLTQSVFAVNRDLFVSRYDDGKWALYEVTLP